MLTQVGSAEMIIVPKSVKHRPVVKALTKFLMIELEGTLNKENRGDLYGGQLIGNPAISFAPIGATCPRQREH